MRFCLHVFWYTYEQTAPADPGSLIYLMLFEVGGDGRTEYKVSLVLISALFYTLGITVCHQRSSGPVRGGTFVQSYIVFCVICLFWFAIKVNTQSSLPLLCLTISAGWAYTGWWTFSILVLGPLYDHHLRHTVQGILVLWSVGKVVSGPWSCLAPPTPSFTLSIAKLIVLKALQESRFITPVSPSFPGVKMLFMKSRS